MKGIYEEILKKRAQGKKMLAVLLDPDKSDDSKIERIGRLFDSKGNGWPDIVLVGGSLVVGDTGKTVEKIKGEFNAPVVLFPGSCSQITDKADGILLLSLISGRNADYLIGQHVNSAIPIKRSNLEVIPTGYILIDGGNVTSVQYVSGTMPIPRSKNDIAVATAVAGEMLGLKMLYLEAGSGAEHPVPTSMIKSVRGMVDIPIIVGGGIRSRQAMADAFNAGADMVVVGTAIEDNPDVISEFAI